MIIPQGIYVLGYFFDSCIFPLSICFWESLVRNPSKMREYKINIQFFHFRINKFIIFAQSLYTNE